MERGELGISEKPGIVFVFEELIAHLEHPRVERAMLRTHKWDLALDQWVFNVTVRSHMQMMLRRYDVPIDVLTWRPIGFAEALYDRLWYFDIPVRSCTATEYAMVSSQMATDPMIQTVYDADPDHRFGYGFKCREFSAGQL